MSCLHVPFLVLSYKGETTGAAERVRVVRKFPHHLFDKFQFVKQVKFLENDTSEDMTQMHTIWKI